jgi:hypothetical protein
MTATDGITTKENVMRGSIAKKIRKSAYKNLTAEDIKEKDALYKTNINTIANGNQLFTIERKPDAPRRFYRRMKKTWLALTSNQKTAIRFSIPTMPTPVQTPAE